MPPYRSLPCHTGCTVCGWPPGMKNKYFSRIFIRRPPGQCAETIVCCAEACRYGRGRADGRPVGLNFVEAGCSPEA